MKLPSLIPAEKYDDDVFSPDALKPEDDRLLYAIALFFAVFVAWACIAKVDELARGPARVIPAGKVQVIQSLEGGIIDAFLVKEGDVVDAGQVLLRMSPIRAASEYQAGLKKMQALRAALVRLEAEVSALPPQFPEDLQKDAPEAVAIEQKAYEANSQRHEDQLAVLQQQYDGAARVLALTRQERDMIAPLVKRGTVSKVDLIQINGRIAAQEAAMGEAEERMRENRSGIESDARKEIAEKTAELHGVEETLETYKDQARRTEIRSPVRGKIKEMKVTTPGGVVQPAQDIMEIVPLDDRLVIEANISPTDIGFLHPGQKATVKLTAYDYAIFGSVPATVTGISADTLHTDKGEPYYRVTLQSDSDTILYKGERLPILPGMVASADIITGKKTVMNYLMNRFRKPLLNAMHER